MQHYLKYSSPILFTSFGPGHLHQGHGQRVLKNSLAPTRNFLEWLQENESQRICKFRQSENRKEKVFFCETFMRNYLKYVSPILFTSLGLGHLRQGQGQNILKISSAMTRNFLVMAPKKMSQGMELLRRGNVELQNFTNSDS